MAYFGGSSGMVGDPGFFGSLFRSLTGGARGFITGGAVGAVAGGVRGFRGGSTGRAAALAAIPRTRTAPTAFRRPVGGGVPPVGTALAGPGRSPAKIIIDAATGQELPRRRRMNVGNARALRRAIRRTDGFVRLAKSALKNTGFKIVSKSSGKVSRSTMDKAVAAAHHRGS